MWALVSLTAKLMDRRNVTETRKWKVQSIESSIYTHTEISRMYFVLVIQEFKLCGILMTFHLDSSSVSPVFCFLFLYIRHEPGHEQIKWREKRKQNKLDQHEPWTILQFWTYKIQYLSFMNVHFVFCKNWRGHEQWMNAGHYIIYLYI